MTPSVGFYAQAYELADGTKIISYRGTDTSSLSATAIDAWNGWRVGAGYYSAAQAVDAAEFFQQVVAGGADTSNLRITDRITVTVYLIG
jgi:hypothetical protein